MPYASSSAGICPRPICALPNSIGMPVFAFSPYTHTATSHSPLSIAIAASCTSEIAVAPPIIIEAVAGLALAFRRAAATASGVVPLGVGLTLLAIAVHSLGYDALFEDPMGWGALGLAACVATARWGEEPA